MITELLAALSFVIAMSGFFLAYKATRSLKFENITEKIDDYLFEENKDQPSRISVIGASLGQSIKMGLLAQKSGDVRHQKMLERRVFEAAKDKVPELKLGLSVLEGLGLGDLATPDNAAALLQIAHKYGLFGFLQGQKNPSSSRGSW